MLSKVLPPVTSLIFLSIGKYQYPNSKQTFQATRTINVLYHCVNFKWKILRKEKNILPQIYWGFTTPLREAKTQKHYINLPFSHVYKMQFAASFYDFGPHTLVPQARSWCRGWGYGLLLRVLMGLSPEAGKCSGSAKGWTLLSSLYQRLLPILLLFAVIAFK